MKLELVDNQRWEEFVLAQPEAEFLNCANWPTVVGAKVLRFLVIRDGQILLACQILEQQTFIFKYWSSARSPIFASGLDKKDKQGIFNWLKAELTIQARLKGVVFWRLEPVDKEVEIGGQPTMPAQPKKTLVLDLTKSNEELLKEMHQKTRYNIKLALRNEVKIMVAQPKDFPDFAKLIEETARRDKFRIHRTAHYQKMIMAGGIFKLYLAKKEEQTLAAGIFAFFGDTVTYVHGASASTNRQLMAPYALHWQIIQEAKTAGFKYYDLYGIDNLKWPGVTRFKLGFGGKEKAYPGAFDIIFKSFYYRAYQLLRGVRRRLKI